MKSYSQLWERITSQENLLAAWGRVRKGHAGSQAVQAFNIGFRPVSTTQGKGTRCPSHVARVPPRVAAGTNMAQPRAVGSASERRAGGFRTNRMNRQNRMNRGAENRIGRFFRFARFPRKERTNP